MNPKIEAFLLLSGAALAIQHAAALLDPQRSEPTPSANPSKQAERLAVEVWDVAQDVALTLPDDELTAAHSGLEVLRGRQ